MTVVVTCGQMRTHGFNDTESSFNSSLHQTHIQRTVVVTGSDTYSALFETIKGPRRIVQTQELPHGQAGGDKEQTKGARLYSCSRVDRTSGARDGMRLARTGKGGGLRYAPVGNVLVCDEILQEGLQSQLPVLQEVAVVVVFEPALGRQRETEAWKHVFQLQHTRTQPKWVHTINKKRF